MPPSRFLLSVSLLGIAIALYVHHFVLPSKIIPFELSINHILRRSLSVTGSTGIEEAHSSSLANMTRTPVYFLSHGTKFYIPVGSRVQRGSTSLTHPQEDPTSSKTTLTQPTPNSKRSATRSRTKSSPKPSSSSQRTGKATATPSKSTLQQPKV